MAKPSGTATPTSAPTPNGPTYVPAPPPPALFVPGTDAMAAVTQLAGTFYRADKDGRIAFVGADIVKAMGYDSADELIGRLFTQGWVNPERRAELVEAVERAGGFVERNIAVYRKDGSIMHCSVSGRAIRDGAGNIAGYIGRLLDQTEGMETRSALIESRAHLEAILDSTNDLIWSVSADDFSVLTFNKEFAEYFRTERGIRVERGLTLAEMFPPGPYVDLWRAHCERALREGPFSVEYVVYTGKLTLRLNFNVLRRGNVPFAITIFGEDITRRRRAEDEARLSEERFRVAFTANPTPMVIADMDLRIVDANPSAVALSGYSVEELFGRTPVEIGVQLNPAMAAANRQRLLEQGRIRSTPMTLRAKSGQDVHVLMSAEPVSIGGQPCALILLQDLTEYKQLQEQFLQAQKMDAVGRLAGGVAHDFNNLLTVIVGRSDWLVTDLPDGELQMQAREILQAGSRATELTEQLLSISRKQPANPAPVRLSAIVADHERMLRRILGEDIRLETSLDDGRATIVADAGQIHQVLMNLAVNARDAMPSGGRATITASIADLGTVEALEKGVAAGSYVVLAVSDSGVGMDDATRRRALEPFFTTKATGKGTGLGLATVQRIVAEAKGFVDVESEPGRGTTISIHFPRVDAVVAEAVPPSIKARIRGTETVLLIEDQDDLRLFATAALERFGYQVVSAPSGVRALEVSRSDQRIDLVVTDIVLPDFRGTEIVDRIRRDRPGTHVLFISGYSELEPGVDWALGPSDGFLRKPFTMGTLAEQVRTLLDRA